MEQTFPSKAIVLERLSFREFDSKIILYSEEFGKMDLVVRGAKRPKSKLAGHIEPISEANFMIVKGKTYDYAGSAVCIDSFANLKNNLEALIESGKAIRIFKRLVEPGEPDPRLYRLLVEYLRAVNKKEVNIARFSLYYYIFIYKFILELGYQPEMEACLKCASTKKDCEYYFNYVRGGILCTDCAKTEQNNLLISSETINFLRKADLIEYSESEKCISKENTVVEIKMILGMYAKYFLRVEL